MTHAVQCILTTDHVEFLVDGVKVAETHRAIKLLETNHPDRYYFPEADVDKRYLIATATQTHCPYKGDAGYYTIAVNGERYRDAAWHYDHPIDSVPELEGTIAFWPEKDQRMQLVVEGVVQ